MRKPTFSTTTKPNLSFGSQDVHYTELLRASDGSALRVRIRSDSHRFQCFAVIERHDGVRWYEVWSIHYGRMATAEGLRYGGATAADFKTDRDALVGFAAAVLAKGVSHA